MFQKHGATVFYLLILSFTVSLTVGHWVENNILGPTCSGNAVEYSNLPEYDKFVKECDHEVKHCRPLCIMSKMGMMNTEGYFLPGQSKSVLQSLLPPVKNRFRATELTGAYESCSLSFNFNDNLGVKHGCSSYAPLFDCFRKSTIMICEGMKASEIGNDIGNAADPWPASFMKPGEPSDTPHRLSTPPPFIPSAAFPPQQPQPQKPATPPELKPNNLMIPSYGVQMTNNYNRQSPPQQSYQPRSEYYGQPNNAFPSQYGKTTPRPTYSPYQPRQPSPPNFPQPPQSYPRYPNMQQFPPQRPPYFPQQQFPATGYQYQPQQPNQFRGQPIYSFQPRQNPGPMMYYAGK